jgi:4-hydroxy-3-methylbut-2-en-1-yl diphosphate reductase
VQITIDPDAGFCYGVDLAIRQAEQMLGTGNKIYCLGDIVHNTHELERLKARGMEVIGHEKLRELRNTTVLIRAHGEPPSTYEVALQNNLKLIDGTCPIVHKLQKRIGEHYSEGAEKEVQIVIFGKEGHAEVAGLTGQTENNAIIVSKEADLIKIDFSKPVTLFSQTTMDQEEYLVISRDIESRMKNANQGNNPDFKVFDTICRQVSRRAPLLEKFAGEHDVIIFVSGSKSSNGRYLFTKCLNANKSTFLISKPDELRTEWLENIETIGITGATSTPLSQLQEVADKINDILH